MKQHFLKILLLFFASIIFINCEKDDHVENESILKKAEEINNVQVKQVSLEEIKTATKLNKTINKIAKQYTLVSKTTKASKTSNSDNPFSILTDEIYQAITSSSEAYTFKMERPLDPDATFENFIIEKRENQDTYHYYIYSYKTINTSNGTEYQALINIKEIIDMNDIDSLNAKLQWMGQCLYRVNEDTDLPDEIVWCVGSSSPLGGGDGGNGNNGNSSSNEEEPHIVPNGDGTCNIYIMTTGPLGYPMQQIIRNVNCSDYESDSNGEDYDSGNGSNNSSNSGSDNVNDPHFNDDTPISTESGSGSGSSSSSNSGNTSTVVTVPVVPYDVQIMNCLGTYVLTTGNTSIQAWLDKPNTNHSDIKGLAYFLDDNCSSESQEFAKLAIEALMSDEVESFDDIIKINFSYSNTVEDVKKELECFDKTEPAKLTIYVEQAIENSRDVTARLGHTFIGIEQNETSRNLGFYPESNLAAFKNVKSEIHDNSNSPYHVSISIDIISSQLESIIDYIEDYPKTYNLNVYNCSDFGIKIAGKGGLSLPETIGKYGFLFEGRNPSDLGEDIRELDLPTGVTRNLIGGNAPTRSSDCP